MYLGENITIRRLTWEFLTVDKPSIFLTDLAVHLWNGENILANRALDLTHGVSAIPNRSPVKLIEHNLLRLLISEFTTTF